MTRGTSIFRSAALLLPIAALLTPLAVHADDLKLKDGSTVSGTIVGYEENSFKVKTSYGYAVVQKDQVVSIGISEPNKPPAEKSPEPAAEKSKKEPAPPPLPAMAGLKSEPAANAAPSAETKTTKNFAPTPATAPIVKDKNVASAKSSAPAPLILTPAAAAPIPVANAAPPKPPGPEPIREAVNGNVYTNETYRFHMYKPPDWDVIATAPTVLPGAITAMGTGDDTTYLLIGQEPAGKSLATDMDATERRLRDVMVNFRPLGEKQITVSGAPVTESHFRGTVDEHEWSGVVVLVPRGAKLYTIFGMTRADNDLVQIQENVIARAISSLQFSEQ
jgi:hypothetical protein